MILIDLLVTHGYEVAVTLACFAGSLLVATLVVQGGLRRLRLPHAAKPRDAKSTGFWVGFFETILVFVFVFHDEFGALAIIFAAKELVQREKVAQDPGYYLLGTMANVSASVLAALLAMVLVAMGT